MHADFSLYHADVFFAGIFTTAFDNQIEWLIVKGISDYADGAEGTAESWSNFASVMAASFAAHILSDPHVFRSWPNYGGKHLSYAFSCDLCQVILCQGAFSISMLMGQYKTMTCLTPKFEAWHRSFFLIFKRKRSI